ncbi:MAG: carbon-nitrogen hydrolase family protein [Pirellulaceae bacterium]|nr:carbon-nitrogen hydrolase family protein [Pirellulaceae bacterium]
MTPEPKPETTATEPSRSKIKIGLVQMCATLEKEKNLETAANAICQAAKNGANLVCLPELFSCYGDLKEVAKQAEPIGGATFSRLQSWAREHKIWLLGGSFCEQRGELSTGSAPQKTQQERNHQKAYNTSCLFGPTGETLATYRKIHLFDLNIPIGANCESDHLARGDEIVDYCSPIGHFGFATCYDLRFPELFRYLVNRDCELIFLPAAFTHMTGKYHWEPLLRARAIENQCYMVAPNQCGKHNSTMKSYGHSMIIDPWGEIVATAGATETILYADINLDRVTKTRSRFPVLNHRRLPKDLND